MLRIRNTIRPHIIQAFFLGIFFLFVLSFPTHAATGIYRTINFQGKVVNKADGTNLTNQAYNFIFTLYDAASGGTQLPSGSPWSETQSLTVTDGIFRATLGAVTPIPTTVDFNSDSIYLNISFSGETFTTRIRFTAVPYAFNSEKVNGLTVTATTGTLTIPSATTVTFSGANNLTFTTSNITSATLPAGTITLADTSSNQTFTTKTIGSTGLVFSGAATDITTVSNEDFIVTPQGTGKVGIGGAPTEMLGVVGNATASGNITLGGQLQVGRFGYDPIAFGNGSIAYNTTTNKLRCYQNGAWTDCIGTGVGGGTLQTVYDASSVSEVTLNTTNNGLTILNAAADAITGNLFEVGNNAGSTLFLGVTKTGSSFNANAVTTENALSLSATGLTTGNGLLLTVGNPEANSNSGTFSKGDLINISSANHTYMTLDNKDLTIGGHKTNITISGVTDVFMYDTGGDMDGGKWTDGARAMASTWYNETLDDASADCNIATMDRCDQKAFPNKAIIVSTATNVYIFNALNNSMWMRFDKGPTTTEWMIGPTTNSTVSTVFALNGKLYIGNAGSVGQMFGVNFISDIAKKYNATDDYQGNIKVGSRNSAVTWVSSIGQPLPGTVISDIYGNVINGKVYIAIALEPTNGSANGSASVLNETDQTIVNFGISGSNTASKNIWLTPVGDLYTTIGSAVTNSGSTNYFIKAKHQIQNLFPNSNNNTFSEIYGNVGTSTTQYGVSVVDAAFGSVTFANGPAPVDATFIPQSLFVTAGTSIDNGRSNTIYVGNNDNLMLLQEKQATPIQGNVKYYTKDYISEYMFSDVRGMWPLSGTSPLNDVSVTHVASNNLTNNGTSTFTSGVRGTGATFSGSSQYLSLADNVPMSVTGSVSFGGWFKTNSTSTQQYIVTKNGSYTLEVTAAGKVQAVITGASTGTRISTNSIDTGWHQVIAVYNSAKPSLDLYLDGILTNGTLTGTLPSAISDTAGAFNIGANAGANFFNGSIDEVFVTADAIDASIIKSMYRVGYRALSMHSSDTLQQLVGSSSQVNAAAVDLEGGTIYAGTAGGGVTVIGNDTDSQIKTYTASGPADDTGTTFANSTINSFSIGRGFGVGDITVIGNGAGVWIESADTSIKDFLSQAYNPFGITMDQSILNVDNVLRVTNQLSTRLDNLAAYGSPQIGLIEFFRADANGAAATNYQSMGGALTLQAGKLDPNIKFLDPNGTIKGRLDVSSPYGTGADGPIAVSTTKNLNTDAIANGRTRPDGIAYRVNAPASGAVGVTSFTRYTATDDLSNGIAAGDEVLLINMQGNTADIADVGKYLFLKVGAITPSTITFIGGTGNTTFGGGTPGNQKVFIQRVPNYTSVALSGSGILTATAYSTTAPTAPAGWSTGIVAFRSNSTVTLATGTSINVTGKGYRGGAGGTAGANGGVSGETIDSLSLTVGSGVGQGGNGATAPTAGYGGGRGGDGALTAPGTGATANRGGGGGGGSAGSTGTGTVGAGGGAGGSYGTAGGGGGGGATTNAAGGNGGTANALPGGGGGAGSTTGGAGGTGTLGGSGTGVVGVGGAVGTATTNAGGGGGSAVATGAGGAGGGGTPYGNTTLTQLFPGSGGGGGGGTANTVPTAGGAGGNGGGIVFIAADSITVTSTGAINAQGVIGTGGTTNSGAGGSGAGGSILIQGRSITLGSSLVTAAAIGAVTKVGAGGGGGGGGVGRIAVQTSANGTAFANIGTTTPTAVTAGTAVSDYGVMYVRATNTSAGDVAENYTTGDPWIGKGDVVVLGDSELTSEGEKPVERGVLRRTTSPYDQRVIGVVSSEPGLLLGSADGADASKQQSVALVGRVPIKVSLENGPIKIGDYLTTSTTPGVAMKATKPGPVIARALENFDNESGAAGLIDGFIKDTYFNGDTLADVNNIVDAKIASLEARLNMSSASAQLLSDTNYISSTSGLTLMGNTTTYTLSVIDKIKLGLLTIESDEHSNGSIQTAVVPLQLQKDSLGNLEIMGSKIVIDTFGNMVVRESITAKDLQTKRLTILDEKDATSGAVLSSTAGKSQIAAGETIVHVKTSALTEKSLIFATPENIPTGVAAKKLDDTTIEISIASPISTPLKINWWIIN